MMFDWDQEINIKRWLRKHQALLVKALSLKGLKIVTIASPILFFCVLELLRRYTVLGGKPIVSWGTLLLLIVVIIAGFLFYKLVFAVINHLQEQNVKRLRELSTLSEVYQSLDEFHNPQALLSRVLEKLIQITAVDSAELYLFDEKSHELQHALHTGLVDDVLNKERHLQLIEWIIDQNSQSNQQVIMENLTNLQNGLGPSLLDVGMRSLALIPLNSRSGAIGAICLFSLNSDHYKPTEANLLFEIGNLISLAIEKARLYEKVQAIAVVEERERIANELHDGLAQVLGYVITKSQATRQLLQKMIVANDYLAELEDVAQEVYTDTREAILGLKTAITGDGSMVSALGEYAIRFSQMHNIKTELTVGERRIPSLSPQVELQVIRIVQEALSNVRKHSQAKHAMINVAAQEDKVTIAVQDDGKGFDVDGVGSGDWTKFGLRNMKERADNIHSSLSVESRPDNGTKVTLSIPLTFSEPVVDEGNKNESTDS
ncbi:GAF domain-containing sensor histidine kinase [Chloroflexota bacterium]